MSRRRPRARIRPRDLFAAETLARAAGSCDICATAHGNRQGPLIACVNGIVLCLNCQRAQDIPALGTETVRVAPGGPGAVAK